MTSLIYDPFKFIGQIELFTMTVLGSFVTWKLLNALYDNFYELIIDIIVESGESDKYFMKIGKHHVQIGVIYKEFIKWIFIIIILMFGYNVIVKKHTFVNK
uniref:Uncharacterized protein n=1 Tax=viral metagenome TaxID=1070528 RepID=A0A6C0LTC7_9ZZZZ